MAGQCPFDVIRTIRMSDKMEIPNKLQISSLMRHLINERGWKSLWRGVGPALWRDVPFSGLYWIGAENFRSYFEVRQNFKNKFMSFSSSGFACYDEKIWNILLFASISKKLFIYSVLNYRTS